MTVSSYDLPTEIWLSILRHVDSQSLFRTVRLVDRRSRSCADDIFRNEILPDFQISLNVLLESEYPLRPGGDVQLVFGFRQVTQWEDDGTEVAQYTVIRSDPEVRKQRALARWKGRAEPVAARDPLMLRVTLPPQFLVNMQGRAWQDCVCPSSDTTTGRYDKLDWKERDELLQLDWRKFMATYLRKTSALEKIADQRRQTIGSRFPMY
ncbi:uncharacterized protein MYCGRDRAFT_110841 [Zymoseptoria tritici IPO323]|uniref:F-box domain-containing protein n=1 Tax=Zymoseptoria tritici (strain CBS 115943 / IPO323) TaxID=336722 RepID=F9XJN1_ZYMTI|nr:uncharacterized protein MYCGRDRAFT_110841 [Zymoseptoria tritici IPO323]EGP84610.1 hypothetical protein MYCGRDRAFT_110841 [Zymoseptoria tritici IPO323]